MDMLILIVVYLDPHFNNQINYFITAKSGDVKWGLGLVSKRCGLTSFPGKINSSSSQVKKVLKTVY